MLNVHLLNKQLDSMAIKISGTKPGIQESSECGRNEDTFCAAQNTVRVKLKD